jgi:hypothetical protein
MGCKHKNKSWKIGFCLITFSKIILIPVFSPQIVALGQTRHLRKFSGFVRRNFFYKDFTASSNLSTIIF